MKKFILFFYLSLLIVLISTRTPKLVDHLQSMTIDTRFEKTDDILEDVRAQNEMHSINPEIINSVEKEVRKASKKSNEAMDNIQVNT